MNSRCCDCRQCAAADSHVGPPAENKTICPSTWKRCSGEGWAWLRDAHGSVWQLLGADRWECNADGIAEPTRPIMTHNAASSLHDDERIRQDGEAHWFQDPKSGAYLAAALVSDANELWVFAVPAGPGVAVNDRPVVAGKAEPMDVVQIGTSFFLVDSHNDGEWLFQRLNPIDGLHVAARHVSLQLKGGPQLGPIDLDVPAGQFLGIAAPSGTGKTRLVRILSKLDPPQEGRVDWWSKQDIGQPLGYADQHDTVYADLPALESLTFTGRLRGLSEKNAEEKAKLALRQMRLDHLINAEGRYRLISQLSGGERHRVSVAGELLADHPMVVLDEPTTGLDPVMSQRLVRQFHARARRGQTIMMTTHELDLFEYCDRVIILRQERTKGNGGHPCVHIAADGTPKELKEATGEGTLPRAIRKVYQGADLPIPPSQPSDLPAHILTDVRPGLRHSTLLKELLGSLKKYGLLIRERLAVRDQTARRDKRGQTAKWLSKSLSSLLGVKELDEHEQPLLKWCSTIGYLRLPIDSLLFWLLPIAIVFVIYAADLKQPMMQYLVVVTTLWLAMSSSVLAIVAHRDVWERERHLGLAPSAQLVGCLFYHGGWETPRVFLIVACAIVLHLVFGYPPSLIHGTGLSGGLSWLLLVPALLLVAWTGTAFGLAISSMCKRSVTAQQWLACVLLAQILLTVQMAGDVNLHKPFEDGVSAPQLIHMAAGFTSVLWGHALLKIADSAHFGLRDFIFHAAGLITLMALATSLAWAGLLGRGRMKELLRGVFEQSMSWHARVASRVLWKS